MSDAQTVTRSRVSPCTRLQDSSPGSPASEPEVMTKTLLKGGPLQCAKHFHPLSAVPCNYFMREIGRVFRGREPGAQRLGTSTEGPQRR